jgi:hypothetical protein
MLIVLNVCDIKLLQKVLTTGALSDPLVAFKAIDILLELVFCHKIHLLGKNCLSEMHFRSNKGSSACMISNRYIFMSSYLSV